MGIIIALIFGLFVLGLMGAILGRIFRGISGLVEFIIPFVLLAAYAWAVIKYTSTTLWVTGAFAALIAIGMVFERRNTAKIKHQLLQIIDNSDLEELNEIYNKFNRDHKKKALDIIIDLRPKNLDLIIKNLFFEDLKELFDGNLNSATGEVLLERSDFEAHFQSLWANRLNISVIEMAEGVIPRGYEIECIDFQNQKDKNKKTRLIKIRNRQKKDSFEEAIDLD